MGGREEGEADLCSRQLEGTGRPAVVAPSCAAGLHHSQDHTDDEVVAVAAARGCRRGDEEELSRTLDGDHGDQEGQRTVLLVEGRERHREQRVVWKWEKVVTSRVPFVAVAARECQREKAERCWWPPECKVWQGEVGHECPHSTLVAEHM